MTRHLHSVAVFEPSDEEARRQAQLSHPSVWLLNTHLAEVVDREEK